MSDTGEMKLLIKITDAEGYTRRGLSDETLWLPPGTKPPRLSGTRLCAEGVYHAYRSPEQAVFMDPVHAQLLPSGKAWWADGAVIVDDGTKVGCHDLTIVEPCDLPELAIEVRIRTSIYAVQLILPRGQISAWDSWATAWLAGKDRSADAAHSAADAAHSAADAAHGVHRAHWAAAWVAESAAVRAAGADAAWAVGAAKTDAAETAAACAPIDLLDCLTRAIEETPCPST